MQEVDRLGWAATIPLRAGEHVLGVRVNTTEVDDRVRDLFADRLAPQADPPPNLSVYLPPATDEGPAELNRLYVNCTRTVRTRDDQPVLEALWHELDMRDDRTGGQNVLLDATVVTNAGGAHILPGRLRRAVADDERRWNADGFRLVHRRWVPIDVEAGALLLPAPPPAMTTRSTNSADLERVDVRPLGQSVPIASWTVRRGDPVGPAATLALAANQIMDRSLRFDAQDVGRLAQLLETLSSLSGWTDIAELRSQLGQRQT